MKIKLFARPGERRKGKKRSEWSDIDTSEVYKIKNRKDREKYIRENAWLETTPDGLEYVDNYPGYYKPYVSSLSDDKFKHVWHIEKKK